MSNFKLSIEEQELLDSVESGNFESALTESRRRKLESIADNTLKEEKTINNIRVSNRDFAAIQARALREGLPYQTLVSSIIHKYISGSLQDLTAKQHK